MICTTEANRPGFVYTPLFSTRLIAVCSPSLIATSGSLSGPDDLERFTLLQVYTTARDWDVWLETFGASGLRGAATTRFDSYLLALEAASDGQGIALVPDFLALPDLRSGRLVQPFSHSTPQPAHWYLVFREDRAGDPSLERFRDWLISEVRSDPVLSGSRVTEALE
jgi:LysR family glycine cleavage system transcriptional activator